MTANEPSPIERLDELARRCEAAEGPDRELDLDIQIAVDPEYAKIEQSARRFFAVYGGQLTYTASLDAAMSLVPEGWAYIDFRRFVDGTVGCDMEVIGVKLNTIEACAATPALALTAAALRAHASQGDAS